MKPAPHCTKSAQDPAAKTQSRGSETAGQVVARLIGRSLRPEEIATTQWYEDLQGSLLAMRRQSGQTQAEIAAELGVRQSEVSRFENAIGPGTQLGKIRAYAEACGHDLTLSFSAGSSAFGSKSEVVSPAPRPAVPVEQSVQPDFIICLEDGKSLKMLKRHLRMTYDMSPQEYRERWHLPADYPMVAPSYAKQRAGMAKKLLGPAAPRPQRKKAQ